MEKQSGFGIAGMILGIIGLMLSCFIFGGFLGLIGLIFSSIGIAQKDKNRGAAVAGLTTSIVSILFSGIMFLLL